MADNVTIPATGSGTATPVVATDDIAGVHYQRVKLVDGTLDSTAAIAGDATNGLDVDVTRLPALVAGTANIGDVDVLTVPAPLSTTGTGTEATALRVTVATDSTGVLSVDDNGGSLTVDAPIGTPVNVQVGNATLAAGVVDETGASAVDALAVGGGSPHDNVDSGNPIKVGAVAIAHGTNPTAVAAADRTNLYANRAGVLFTMGGHPNVVTLELAATGAQTDVAIVTIGASLKIAVTQLQVICDEANTVGVGFRVGFGTVNTPTTTGVVASHPGMVPGSGLSRGDGSGLLGIGADNEDLRVTSEVPTGGSVRFVVSYFTIES